jgi:DNA-binding SARP family transcriptional activator
VVEFRILGPLEATKDGRAVTFAGGRQRALLAVLLVHANEVVSADLLIDALWGAQPPTTAKTSLQNLVSQIRKLLGPDVPETSTPGYVLRLQAEQLDSAQFEQLRARGALADALSLWRGQPYADVYYEDFAQAEIRRLEELRLATIEDLIAGKLETHEPASVVPELQALVEAHPYRERLRRQLMFALYESGRAVDALRTYVEWRARLREEWDTAPGRAIEQTARDIRERRVDLQAAVLWHRPTQPRPTRRRGESADPLELLEIGQALTIFGAVDEVAHGRPDGLDALAESGAASLVEAVLRSWRA